MTILKVLFLIQKPKEHHYSFSIAYLNSNGVPKTPACYCWVDAVDGSNVGIPSKLLNYTDEVNDDEDSEEDPGKKSVFNTVE